jgi:deoxyhypusine synthase
VSIEQIVQEAASLPEQARKQLIGKLMALGRSASDDAELRRELAERIDDQDPAHWISYDELKRRLARGAAGE